MTKPQLGKLIIFIRKKMIHKGENYGVKLQKYYFCNETDDTTLDKPYSKHIDLVYRQGSDKHHQIVNGINLETVVWTDMKL
ncbi:MAG: family transposase [Euryarchaeota archaeon]|nr:family transposase [Euryarchaeota archaeon]